ncbi:protein ANTAGONIST OF LIKE HETEROCHROMATIN PROTEIN 1-like [Nilaparvata lugens]|uniref:protein ANTAGONIST OF LIKE HETEROCHROMATIN PROTEIN 1-like n=1 Tax=Nilaparvata lugens TaxID=108931 RepID=UPI00193DE087|nr:protein ANTAGONIST OF LIKE HETEROCHROMATIN PROTEIN 1-like [Nilaparvata lugens]
MGVPTIRSIVKEVSKAIWTVMRGECMPELTKEKWEAIALGFEKRAQFPHCLGAVDGKHIRIIRQMHSGSMFYNHKEYYSVVLLAVVDSNYKFVYVNVGSYGKECDSSIFKESTLWKSIDSKKLELPDEMCLLGSESPKMPYFFVGDEAFGLNKHSMRPFGGSHLTLKKRIFNYRLCRAQRYVECGFGILTNKLRIFHGPLNVEPEFAVEIVKASVLLHNFVRDRDGYLPEETTTIIGLEDLPRDNMARGGLEANSTRNILSDYFLTNVGSVSWQLNKI